MVAKKKKKYSTGEGAQFVTRGAALHKLQLNLTNFRRLCILKGIYPREPRNRKRAQKGSTAVKTLYHKKDIQFLMQEPIINELRDYKIFYRKVGRARAVKDFKKMRRYLGKHPTVKLDQIVKERYPTFVDALRDLDDCLTLCFLFSTFPSISHIPREQFDTCRRLTMEFLHYVIEAKALRKVFVSIKGYYYQAEILGQTITWIVPHHFSYQPQQKGEVDFKIMSTFVEFYVIMLGFVNFRLYHSLNIYYPPKLSGSGIKNIDKQLIDEEAYVSERISALNVPLSRISEETPEEVEIDEFPNDGSTEELEEAKQEALKVSKLRTLFKGLKVFLNREVPREPLVFMLRCFGAEVSWDQDLFVGSTFEESDETISHQIADRPILRKQYISRYYIQPQWIFDSINARELLPVKKYFIGETLPPHLSPFVDKNRDAEEQYIPPEEKALHDPSMVEQASEESEEGEVEEEVDSEVSEEEEEEEEEEEIDNAENETQSTKPKLTVKSGKAEVEQQPWEKAKQERMDYNLRAKMVKNRHRKLYKDMMESRKVKAKETWLLKKKRRLHDESLKEQKTKKAKGKAM